MKIICVGGTSSNCGKTSLVCMLLKALPGWAAVKVTPCRSEETCPRGHDCSACRAPESRYEIITDITDLGLEGKDTARYLDYGAKMVLWVRALPEFLPLALKSALEGIAEAPGVIIESTTAFQFLNGLHIMVTRSGISTLKESARLSSGNIDIVAVNLESEVAEAPLRTLLFPDLTSITVCALFPHEHPENRRFVDECLTRVGELDGNSNYAA